jgi:hypothetical protein
MYGSRRGVYKDEHRLWVCQAAEWGLQLEGATIEHLELMKKHIGPNVRIQAVGVLGH